MNHYIKFEVYRGIMGVEYKIGRVSEFRNCTDIHCNLKSNPPKIFSCKKKIAYVEELKNNGKYWELYLGKFKGRKIPTKLEIFEYLIK